MDEIIKILKSLPKQILLLIIYQLMREGKITYHELTDLHIKHLEELEKGMSDNYFKLQGEVFHLWNDTKKNRDSNLKAIMHRLVDEGRLNMNHEQIDKRWKHE